MQTSKPSIPGLWPLSLPRQPHRAVSAATWAPGSPRTAQGLGPPGAPAASPRRSRLAPLRRLDPPGPPSPQRSDQRPEPEAAPAGPGWQEEAFSPAPRKRDRQRACAPGGCRERRGAQGKGLIPQSSRAAACGASRICLLSLSLRTRMQLSGLVQQTLAPWCSTSFHKIRRG